MSLAVATSAAFPPYLGPTSVQIAGRGAKAPEFWHLGDGGVVENSGVETLREAIYARGRKQRAKIYVFNAGQRLDHEKSKASYDISIWSREVTRLVDVLQEYASAHRDTMFAALDAKHDMKVEIIKFNYLAIAEMMKEGNLPSDRWLTWTGWHHATHAVRTESKTPAEHLAKIPTALKITACDRELIAMAAVDLVDHHFETTAVK